jgi:hypothetical protein
MTNDIPIEMFLDYHSLLSAMCIEIPELKQEQQQAERRCSYFEADERNGRYSIHNIVALWDRIVAYNETNPSSDLLKRITSYSQHWGMWEWSTSKPITALHLYSKTITLPTPREGASNNALKHSYRNLHNSILRDWPRDRNLVRTICSAADLHTSVSSINTALTVLINRNSLCITNIDLIIWIATAALLPLTDITKPIYDHQHLLQLAHHSCPTTRLVLWGTDLYARWYSHVLPILNAELPLVLTILNIPTFAHLNSLIYSPDIYFFIHGISNLAPNIRNLILSYQDYRTPHPSSQRQLNYVNLWLDLLNRAPFTSESLSAFLLHCRQLHLFSPHNQQDMIECFSHCIPHLRSQFPTGPTDSNNYNLILSEMKTLISNKPILLSDMLSQPKAESNEVRPPHSEPPPDRPVASKSSSRLNECIICMDAERQTVFTQCGHVLCCLACAANQSTCPICGTASTAYLRIYFS